MPFPDLCYSSISYRVQPEIERTVFHSKNTRQRYLRQRHEPRYSVSVQLDSTKLGEFESFVTDEISNGADEFTGPYFDGLEQSGTLQIVDGKYSVSYLAPNWWNLSYSFDVKDRNMDDAECIYDLVNDHGGFEQLQWMLDTYGGFEGVALLFNAIEDCVNNNALEP